MDLHRPGDLDVAMLGSRYSVYQIRSYVCMQFVEVRCFIHNQLRWPSLLTSFNSSGSVGVLAGIWGSNGNLG